MSETKENQGIPYILRRIQIIDAVLLTAILAMFGVSLNTNTKVSDMAADYGARKELDKENPPIRKGQYDIEVAAIRGHLEAVDVRVVTLEEKRRR